MDEPRINPNKLNQLHHVYPTWGPEHDVHGLDCWCNPEPDIWEPLTIVHFPPEDAGH